MEVMENYFGTLKLYIEMKIDIFVKQLSKLLKKIAFILICWNKNLL